MENSPHPSAKGSNERTIHPEKVVSGDDKEALGRKTSSNNKRRTNSKSHPKSHHQQQQRTTDATRSSGEPKSSPENPGNGSPGGVSSKPKVIKSNFDEFARKAKELKSGINLALDRQASLQITEQQREVLNLRDDVLKLTLLSEDIATTTKTTRTIDLATDVPNIELSSGGQAIDGIEKSDSNAATSSTSASTEKSVDPENKEESVKGELKSHANGSSQETQVELANTASSLVERAIFKPESNKQSEPAPNTKRTSTSHKSNGGGKGGNNVLKSDFDILNARLDHNSKYVALSSSLEKHFKEKPEILGPICSKLIDLSENNELLSKRCHKYHGENQKLLLIKDKLENLCRELQKSNNAIRIESLDLIKAEQARAKEQTDKIQSTLAGVIKLFDENQQRNMNLRQENLDLQSKMKTLLEHCDNWEKSVETELKQRDLENRLVKTELAKANLLNNEEREKFLKEKKDLLHVLSLMQEQQHRIIGQEAKLRSDLSSYASKYDECQSVIHQGMNKFQVETKRMLKQLETSRNDYVALLKKYEASTKRIDQLLKEKQTWDKSMKVANKKVETLEKLCRALKADMNSGDGGEPSPPQPSLDADQPN